MDLENFLFLEISVTNFSDLTNFFKEFLLTGFINHWNWHGRYGHYHYYFYLK